MDTFSKRQADSTTVSGKDLSPVLQIVTWFLLCLNVLAVVVGVWVRHMRTKEIALDDALILLALLFSIAQSIATSLQNLNGYGQHLARLSSLEIIRGQKAAYAADILFVICLCLAQLAVAAFLWSLTPRRGEKRIAWASACIVAAWALSSVFVISFQCHLPSPWNYISGRCLNRMAFWSSFYILDIIADLTFVVLPITLILRIQTSLFRRFTVCSMFLFRTTAIAAAICCLVFWNRVDLSRDSFYTEWKTIVCRQILVSASILSTCMTQLKRVLELLSSGMMHVDDLRRRGQVGEYGYTGTRKSDQDPNSSSDKGWPYIALSDLWKHSGKGDVQSEDTHTIERRIDIVSINEPRRSLGMSDSGTVGWED